MLAALAAHARGEPGSQEAAELRTKESDRLDGYGRRDSAPSAAHAGDEGDDLVIAGGGLGGGPRRRRRRSPDGDGLRGRRPCAADGPRRVERRRGGGGQLPGVPGGADPSRGAGIEEPDEPASSRSTARPGAGSRRSHAPWRLAPGLAYVNTGLMYRAVAADGAAGRGRSRTTRRRSARIADGVAVRRRAGVAPCTRGRGLDRGRADDPRGRGRRLGRRAPPGGPRHAPPCAARARRCRGGRRGPGHRLRRVPRGAREARSWSAAPEVRIDRRAEERGATRRRDRGRRSLARDRRDARTTPAASRRPTLS